MGKKGINLSFAKPESCSAVHLTERDRFLRFHDVEIDFLLVALRFGINKIGDFSFITRRPRPSRKAFTLLLSFEVIFENFLEVSAQLIPSATTFALSCC